MNYFDKDMAWSHDTIHDNQLDAFYKRAFPHLREIEKVADLRLQKSGVDKILVLNCGKRILIDEKLRRVSYGDILLEEYSDFDKKVIGWLSRNKQTDYIVYAVIPANTVYLLPFLLLQSAYRTNYSAWLTNYGRKFAINPRYKTSNIPVPTSVLLSAIGNEMKKRIVVQ